MRATVLAAMALVLTVGASPAWSAPEEAGQPDLWYCEATAKGEAGSEMNVALYVEADGKVVARTAAWDPPRIWSGTVAKGLDDPAPSLTVLYIDATATDVGPPFSVMIAAAGDAKRVRFDQLGAVFVMDGDAGRWQAEMESMPAVKLPDGSAIGFATALIDRDDGTIAAALGKGGTGVASVTGRKGATLASARFDFSATAGRDAMFRRALAEAEGKARTPTACEKTQAGDLPATPVP